MATIDDFGDVADPLGQPQLGGPTGWAAAVRDFITGLPGDIAAVASDLATLTTTVAGKVSKAGDTMTGALTVSRADRKSIYLEDTATPGASVVLTPRMVNSVTSFGARTADDAADAALLTADPVHDLHAANRNYVDTKMLTDTSSPVRLRAWSAVLVWNVNTSGHISLNLQAAFPGLVAVRGISVMHYGNAEPLLTSVIGGDTNNYILMGKFFNGNLPGAGALSLITTVFGTY